MRIADVWRFLELTSGVRRTHVLIVGPLAIAKMSEASESSIEDFVDLGAMLAAQGGRAVLSHLVEHPRGQIGRSGVATTVPRFGNERLGRPDHPYARLPGE